MEDNIEIVLDPSMHSTGGVYIMNNVIMSAFTIKVSPKITGSEAIFNMYKRTLLALKLYNKLYAGEIKEVVDTVIAEVQEWRGRGDRSNPGNIINLNGVCYALLFGIPSDNKLGYTPTQWKRTMPSAVVGQRTSMFLINHHKVKKSIVEKMSIDALTATMLAFFHNKNLCIASNFKHDVMGDSK